MSNYLVTGDWHITEKVPENRIDDYCKAQYRKINWILATATANNAVILQPGDLTDSPRISYETFIKYHSLFDLAGVPIFVVAGQHDLRYHTNIHNTPLYALHQTEVVQLAMGLDCIYGAGWEEEIPIPNKKHKYNILLTHRMVIDEKLWKGQGEATYARNLLRKNDYDIIVSGDNHKFFIEEYKGKILFNMGSLMRSTIAQMDHIPQVAIWNSETKDYTLHKVPIEPASEVFQVEKTEKQKKMDAKISAFVEGLIEDKELGLDFESNILAAMKTNKIKKSIRKIILKAMEEE